jgi:hypothetical protein
MKRERPGPEATDQEMFEWYHACMEGNASKGRRVSIGAAITIILTIMGFSGALLERTYHIVVWTDTVNAKLDTLTTAGIRRDNRLDSIDVRITQLQGTANENRKTLLGADRTARSHHR